MSNALRTLYGCLALVVLFAAPLSFAATVATQEGTGVFPITTTNNLLTTPTTQGTATYTGFFDEAADPGYGATSALTNGLFGNATPSADKANVVTTRTNATAQYDLNLTTNPTGYILSSIEVFGGWNDAGRDRQRFDVFYQPLAGGNFIQIASVNFNPTGGTPSNTFVNITALGLNNIAVRAVRFTFPDQENNYDGYREISVFGTVAPPTVTAPTITPATGFYENNVSVTVTQTEAGGSTYYTTDGTEPTSTNGTLLVGANVVLPINTNTTRVTNVRAQTFKAGSLQFAASNTYTGYNAAVTVTGDLPGLRCINYETNGQLLPHDPITIITQQRRVPGFNGNNPANLVSVTPRSRDTNFGYRFTGYIRIDTKGVYRFFTNSDDGSRLFLDGALIVENNFGQGYTERFGDVALQPGKHAFRVEFSQGGGGFGITSRYSAVGSTTPVDYDETLTPSGVFTTEEVIETPVISITGGGATFTGTTAVSISSVPANATIYYTTDGSTPTTDSYNGTLASGGTFNISATTTVKAIAKLPGAFDGGVASATFTRTDVATSLLTARPNSLTEVDAIFSVPMASGGAYTVTGSTGNIVVNSAVATGNTVRLTLAGPLNPTTLYTVTAGAGVQSAANVAVGPQNTATFRYGANGVLFEKFEGITGVLVSDLTASAAYQSDSPSSAQFIPTFNFTDTNDNYGSRMRAFLTVPTTGNYRFRLNGDDQTILYTANDGNPANATALLTAQVNTVTSGVVALTAGQEIFIQILHKEGGGGDYANLRWETPTGGADVFDLIPNNLLRAFDLPYRSQGLLREFYLNIGGGDQVSILTGNAKYPNSPDQSDLIQTFESPNFGDALNQYGLRISGFFVAPQSGNYNFYVAGDDDCELHLSTDATPANAVKICQKIGAPYGTRDFGGTAQQKSANIALVAGQKYWIFGLMKEGGGGDGIGMAYSFAATGDPAALGNGAAPAGGGVLQPPSIKPLTLNNSFSDKRVRYGTGLTLTASVSGGAYIQYQWFKNNVAIPGATSASYSVATATGADTGAYRVQVTGSVDGVSFSVINSNVANIQVFTDVTLDTATLTQSYNATQRVVTATVSGIGPSGAPNVAVPNGSFETPTVAGFAYGTAITGGTWTFSAEAGIAANGSAFTNNNPAAPDGTQVALIQFGGTIEQTLPVANGFYTINVRAAQRGSNNASFQRVRLRANGVEVAASIQPPNNNYATFTSNIFEVTTGSLAIRFEGLNPNGGDNTLLLDNVQVVPYARLPYTVTYNGSATAPTNAGTYPVVASTTGGVEGIANGTLTVNKALLTVTANDATREYGQANPAFTATLSGYFGADTTANATTGTAGLTTTALVNSNIGPYPIVPTLGTLASGNYSFPNLVNGTLTVTKATNASVAVNAQGGTIFYDGQPHVATSVTTPAGLNVTYTYNGNASAVNANSYTVVATIADNNADAGTATTGNGSLVISKVAITANGTVLTRTYGDTSPILPVTPVVGTDYTFTGLVNNETGSVVNGSPALSTTAVAATTGPDTPGSPVGDYPITVAIGSLNATNYNVTAFTSGTLRIGKRSLNLQANSITLEYGQPNPPTLGYSVVTSTLAPGDTAAIAITGGAPGVSSTRTPTSNVGVYPITLTQGSLVFSPNYQIGSTVNGNITVTQATTAAVTVPSPTVTFNGAPQGVTPVITPAGLNANVTYNGSATVPTNAGTYAVVATINDPNAAGNPTGNGTLVINKAAASVSVFNLFQQQNGTPRPVTVATTPAGLTVDVTYNGSTTAPTAPGTYAVVATVNEPNYQGSSTATLRVGGPPPVITSALVGTPNPVQVGKTVVFSIAATHPLNMPLTISYDYGDGVSDATGVHVYTFPQIATVTASVSDGVNTITSTIQVLVVSAASPEGDLDGDGIPNSSDDDDDGDGLSDAFEEAAGSSPLDAGNSPLDDPAQAKNPGPLDVKKMSIKLSFSKTLTDSITISGTLPVKAGFVGTGKKVVVDVGGVIKSFTLTSKFAAKTATDSIKIGVKAKKGVVAAQTAKYAIKIAKGTFSTALADDGLGNENAKNKSTTVRVDVLFGGQFLRKQVTQIYSAKQGSSGRTK